MKNIIGIVKCFIGFHPWKVVKKYKCIMKVSNLFTGVHDAKGLAVVRQCTRCGLWHGYITDGTVRETMDVDFLLSSME